MENKKQTPIDWLLKELTPKIEWIPYKKFDAIAEIIDKAKAIEKEQIIDAYLQKRGKGGISEALKFWDEAEQYYNETYGKSESISS
jgi:hypothetical protein